MQMDIDDKRKRFLFNLCALIILLIFPILIIINYMEGDILEIEIDLVIVTIILAGLFAVKKSNQTAITYRLTLTLLSIVVLYSVAIGAGEESVLYWVFNLPILFFFFFGKWEGLTWTLLLALILGLILGLATLLGTHVYSAGTAYRFFITFGITSILAFGLESARYASSQLLSEKNRALLEEKERLEQALNQVQVLRALIPICSHCKKVRDDSGYWQQVETYVRDHFQANFSHGICPDCAEKLYSDFIK